VARAVQTFAAVLAISVAVPSAAFAYDDQVSLDVGMGWGFAPGLEMFPNHGPLVGVATTIGIDDTWGVAIHGAWALHPPFVDDSDPVFHVGQVGAEALYYIDILQVVPFFGAGIDLLPTSDGTNWSVDFAAHLRLSVDYLASREIAVGIDVRPYILLTALSTDPVYVSVQLRLSVLFDY